MFNTETKKKNSPEGLDLVTPIVEIFTDLVNGLIHLLGLGIQYGIDQYKARKALVRTIEEKELKSTKSSTLSQDLGFSISRKKPIPLSGIDFSKHSAIFGAAGFGKTNLISILQENVKDPFERILFQQSHELKHLHYHAFLQQHHPFHDFVYPYLPAS